MKVGACVIGTREEWIVRASLTPLLERLAHVVYVTSDTYWTGDPIVPDRSKSIAEDLGADVIEGTFTAEYEMRQAGVDRLVERGCEFVFTIDADEVYLCDQLDRIIRAYQGNTRHSAFMSRLRDFYKFADCEVSPSRKHATYVAFDPLRVKTSNELCSRDISIASGSLAHIMDSADWPYHFGYVRSDEDIRQKLKVHGDRVPVSYRWYEEHWEGFSLESKNFFPFIIGSEFAGVKQIKLPKEILANLDVPQERLQYS